MSKAPAPYQPLKGMSSSWEMFGFGFLLLLASVRFAQNAIRNQSFAEAESYVLYQTGTLAFNYFQFGAIRRGLGGSIAFLLSRDPVAATLWFHVLSAACVAAAAAWLFRRVSAPQLTRLAIGLSMLVVMLRWGDDGGRTDMAIAALLGGTAISLRQGRPVVGALCIAIGLFIHEASFIFGLPLFAALVLQAPDRVGKRQWVAVSGVLAGALLVYAVLGLLPHADRHEMVEVVRNRLPVHEHVDWAIYFALSGMRGVQASICQNHNDPSYWVHPASGLLLIALFCVVLADGRRRWLACALLASLPGFVFLSVVANDISRWAMFACFNVWLIGSTRTARIEGAGASSTVRFAIALMLVPLALYRDSAVVQYKIYAPSPIIEGAVRRLGGPRTPSVIEALDRCDPRWTEVLSAP